MCSKCFRLIVAMMLGSWGISQRVSEAQENRYTTSDSMSGYVHWIELFDESRSKIDPNAENPRPYSSEKTCGRCHDYETISHGWHFNSLATDAVHGRPGQPWIWSDERTGTHLPLSYRGWQGTYNPDRLGISRWQVAAKLGPFMPGGGVGSADALAVKVSQEAEDKSAVTGAVPIDCMLCHHRSGSGYSPFEWTEQVKDENFAYAPTAAMGFATVSGNMLRLKEDFDVTAEGAEEKLPRVTYEASKFRADGTVFFDVVRKPESDACYYCHTNMAADVTVGGRWLHDEDVHLRAGFACADCHRNSLNHHTVRGFAGEQHVSGSVAASFSCRGCHMDEGQSERDPAVVAGRLGAPKPAHLGLPPLHFEKMTCTACHSGPMPGKELERQLNSMAHELGEHVKRTGEETPGILSAVNLPVPHAGDGHSNGYDGVSQVYTPHRLMWPSYWGTMRDGQVTVLNPEKAYELVRRPLKVRDFGEDLAKVSLSLTARKELLGDERARIKEEDRTEQEQAIIAEAEAKERTLQVAERMSGALAAIEEEFPESRAVFVTGGMGYVRSGESDIETIDAEKLAGAADPYAWPVAHNVRPARQALGSTGCTDCHSDTSPYFQVNVTPVGVLPGQVTLGVKAHELQNADRIRLTAWNQMFLGRSLFKLAGLIALGLTCLVALSAIVWNLGSLGRRS